MIPDAPTCAPNQQRIYGVAKQEQAQIKCVVDANPSDVEFKWTFNNSAESIDVANNHVSRTGIYLPNFFFFCFTEAAVGWCNRTDRFRLFAFNLLDMVKIV